MDLFLLRHGAAEPFAERDFDRALTPAGISELKEILHRSRESLNGITSVAASPYLRTQQTSKIVLDFLPLETRPTPQILEFLTPESRPADVLKWLSLQTHQSIMLVTHQPLVGTLLNELCGFEVGLHRMGTGALAFVKLDVIANGMGDFQWLRQV